MSDTDINLVQGIFEALEMIGISKERVSVQSHAQSFLFYALSQKKELWMNDVALFDFGVEGLKFYQISIDRRHRPITVGVSVRDFSEDLAFNMIKELSEEELIEKFKTIAMISTQKQIISTVYITGKGFCGKMDK